MRRVLLMLFIITAGAPLLVACGDRPAKVPVMHEPGQYKTCPGGGTDC